VFGEDLSRWTGIYRLPGNITDTSPSKLVCIDCTVQIEFVRIQSMTPNSNKRTRLTGVINVLIPIRADEESIYTLPETLAKGIYICITQQARYQYQAPKQRVQGHLPCR